MKKPGNVPWKPARPITGAAAARSSGTRAARPGTCRKWIHTAFPGGELRLDCDSDTVLLKIEQIGGAACHTGRRSCFYREWDNGVVRECSPVVFDPRKVYGAQ